MIGRKRRSKSLKLPRAILLDALGTLIELKPPAPLLCEEFQRRFSIPMPVSQAERAIATEIAYYRDHLDEGADMDELMELRRRCVVAMVDELPPEASVVPVEDLTEALLASITFQVFPDVGFALGAARTQGTRLVVVSNWDVSLHEVLAQLELTHLLDGVVISAEHGAGKPDPSIFNQALAVAGVPAGKAVHVGDSIEADVDGARAAGIEPVLMRRDGSPGPPGTRTIKNLIELVVS
ncbi:MAG: putative hydrolase of the superfamily [Solirubrobacteraceae bacterium]|jgi:putative hydrolase of the HAD superfamily|nr:putative hydrolase of the superfamily [Solirubrobacteraceae bacterium]